MAERQGTMVRLLDHFLQWIEYAIALPLMARLPLRIGYWLASWRGMLSWALDREWRSIALAHRYIRAATEQAITEILPELDKCEVRKLTQQRFEAYSREEFEACLLMRNRAGELDFSVRGLDAVREQMAGGRGAVLLTAHFDSFILGIVFLGMSGLKVNVVTSNVVENALVDRCVRHYFFDKYRAVERYLNGGKMVHVEQNPRFFYHALRAGECVVVLADTPASLDAVNSMWIRFLGRERFFLTGAFRLAKMNRSVMAAFVCCREESGHYTVTLSGCKNPEEAALQSLYDFLGAAILRNPERWWASDLLRAFETRND